MKQVVDVDTEEDDIPVTNKATDEESAFVRSIDKDEAEQKRVTSVHSESN